MINRVRNRLVVRVFVALAALALVPEASSAGPQPFQDGDRVCFIGDSITHGGLYHGYIRLFYATRFPERDIRFFNCGISGDSAGGATRRFSWDIGGNRPTVATIMLGMNDVSRGLYGKDAPDEANLQRRQAAIDGHVANMRKLSEQLRDSGSQIVYITPSIYDQTSTIDKENLFGVNDALGICAEHAKKMAAEFAGTVVDFHGEMSRINAECQKSDPQSTIVGGDRVHPGKVGHLIMAHAFLKAQGVCPYVSKTVIDAARSVVDESLHCTVTDLSATSTAVSFTSLQKALPFPVPKDGEEALELVPFLQDLNQEVLAIKGLALGDYELLIDDLPVGIYSATKLATGVNLAKNTGTPQYKQAERVAAAHERQHGLVSRKLRSFVNMEISLRNQGVDLEDPEAVKNAMADRLAKLRDQDSPLLGYYSHQVKLYTDEKGKETQYKEDIRQAEEAMQLEGRPVPHRYVLRKTS
ncbi:MAG: SGNH/GDSL hydrolase family protein [Patescibacteria group bacterium]|nr:SGNH/GDSL hydrolase family protein [Patescibacteria group bacterium]